MTQIRAGATHLCLLRFNFGRNLWALLTLAVVVFFGSSPCWSQDAWTFTCGKPAEGRIRLSAASRYQAAAPASAPGSPFGFDLLPSPEVSQSGACTASQPFFFSIHVPDGNYQVTVTLGDSAPSVTTVRAESRRLFVQEKQVAAGKSATETFNVNVRTDAIAGMPGARVKLKPREIGALDWDEKLTLEFNGEHPAVRSISIRPINHLPTVYLAGDSTVVDQDKEPWAAWGQMIPVFFGPRVVIANEAESGETIRSFTGERRLDKILSTIQPGDYLLIQFAHNDQKGGTPEAMDFRGSLLKYVDAARSHGAFPILITSMNRRSFDANGRIIDTLGGYPQAMREFAGTNSIPLIDLNALSKTLFEAMGPDGTLKAFVHYPAHTFAGQDEELKDDTHFNGYGAFELARAVVQAMRDQKLSLAGYLKKNLPAFDPAHPDDPGAIHLPQSPLVSVEKPYGK